MVKDFYDLLEQLINKHNYTPDRIFNVDETNMSTVPTRHHKIFARKGQKQVYIVIIINIRIILCKNMTHFNNKIYIYIYIYIYITIYLITVYYRLE